MDPDVQVHPAARVASAAQPALRLVPPAPEVAELAPGLAGWTLPACEALVLTKSLSGFTPAVLDACRVIVGDVATGRRPPVKYLVFDFAHRNASALSIEPAFAELAAEVADLVMRAPVVPVAFSRAPMRGADLELALTCSTWLAEAGARFDFDADPVQSLGIYASLARKIGFVRTERLMEQGRVLSADEMAELLLVKQVAPAGAGPEFLESYLSRSLRRHNSHCSIYRAQRLVSGSPVARADLRA